MLNQGIKSGWTVGLSSDAGAHKVINLEKAVTDTLLLNEPTLTCMSAYYYIPNTVPNMA